MFDRLIGLSYPFDTMVESLSKDSSVEGGEWLVSETSGADDGADRDEEASADRSSAEGAASGQGASREQPALEVPGAEQAAHSPGQAGSGRPYDEGAATEDDDEVPWWLCEPYWPGDEADQEAFVAGMPADVREEYEAGPYTGEREAFGCGFTHRDPGGPTGLGFAAGGAYDTLAPGPLLAWAATETAAVPLAGGGGHARLGESELIGVLCAWRRLVGWAQAGEAAAVQALTARRATQAAERRCPELFDHVEDEIAAALVLTAWQASRLRATAAGLAALPAVHAALEAGQLDYARAGMFTDLLAGLDAQTAQAIAAALLQAGAAGMTTAQLRRRLDRQVADADPTAAERRRRRARDDTRVDAWAESSGNAALAGRELAPAEVIAIDRQLTAAARWLQTRGASGTISQLRAAAYTTLLAGHSLATLLPARGEAARPGTDEGGESDSAVGAAVGADAASTDALGADNPGAENAAESGDAASAAAERADGIPGAADTRADRADEPPPSWPQLAGTVNLTMPLDTWMGLADKSGEAAGYGTADPATCRQLAQAMTSGAARWCLTVIDRQGRAVAHACATAGAGPAPGPQALRWAAGLRRKLDYLEDGTCQHRRQTAGHDPSSLLRHLVQVRQRTCSFPGCRRPSTRCDLDHTRAYDQGGRTCECNLSPLCRRHHRAKQAAGWRLEQPQPGILTWHLPHQRSYQQAPEPYPV